MRLLQQRYDITCEPSSGSHSEHLQLSGDHLYQKFVHVNIFTNRMYLYRPILSEVDQWTVYNSTDKSSVFIPRRKEKPKDERGMVLYKHLDLLDLVSR